MGIFSWLCLGVLAGLIVNRILALQGAMLKIVAYLVAVAGAVIGGLVGIRQGWGWGDITSFNIRNFSTSLVGCLILSGLFIISVLTITRSKTHQKIL